MQLHLSLPGDLITSLCHMTAPTVDRLLTLAMRFASDFLLSDLYVLVNIQS